MSPPRLVLVVAAAAALLAAPPALAQAPSGFSAQTFEPAPAGDGFFSVPAPTVPGHLVPAASVTLSWATEPLVLVRGGRTVPGGHLVHRQLWAFAGGSLGLGDRLLVDVSAPVALWQSGSRPFPDLPGVSATGLGDLRVGARVPFTLPWSLPATFAAGLQAWLPAGSRDAFSGDGAARLEPRLVVGGEAGAVEWGGTLGLLWREGKDLGFTRVGSALSWSAAAAWRHGAWRVGPELFGRYQFDGTDTSPVEALLGARWRHGPWDLGLGLGTGFNRAPGAAPVRIVTQATWRPGDEAAAGAAAAREAAARQAAAQAEVAAREAEAARLAAAQAAEAAAAEAARQAAAERDEAARLAEAARVAAAEAAARRATEETANVRLAADRIEILQAIRFETDRDLIRPESEPTLRDVAAVLASHPELARILVEGHTDSAGPAAHNTALSDRRARAVVRWLVEHGIEAGRLSARGYGSAQPVADNATPEGRAANRRVVFRIDR